ncbi:hypothetical protein B4168_1476 [Anoxybacillus flavithermus]|nr:hypothetical protein B4168_1476 [Anoxybacillus flavithermus]OAO84132.1 hypothetical protein GT23_3667 [Parageobacillus thermoglucosidasius]
MMASAGFTDQHRMIICIPLNHAQIPGFHHGNGIRRLPDRGNGGRTRVGKRFCALSCCAVQNETRRETC